MIDGNPLQLGLLSGLVLVLVWGDAGLDLWLLAVGRGNGLLVCAEAVSAHDLVLDHKEALLLAIAPLGAISCSGSLRNHIARLELVYQGAVPDLNLRFRRI